MEIKIIPSLQQAAQAQGLVVVLDIFRASNTVMALLLAGAARLYLLGDVEQALALRRQNPDWLLFGERQGYMLPGMDGDNSPSKISQLDLTGRTAVLSTSAGTQPLAYLQHSGGPVFYGCFANAGALLNIIKQLAPPVVNLMPMGRNATLPVVEDSSAAQYLAARLQGREMAFAPLREAILASDSADILRQRGLEDDMAFCTSLDTHSLTPVVDFSGPYPQARPWG